MHRRAVVKPSLYKDSVALMRIGRELEGLAGVRRATLLMGTPANRELLRRAKLDAAELDAARPNDLMIVVEAETRAALEGALAQLDRALAGESGAAAIAEARPVPLRSLGAAAARGLAGDVAVISVPGAYAGAEALKALKLGLHVFLFSNGVALEEERELKLEARKRGLLVMGPDCGTAILRGVPLGFANVVRRGGIGLVAASGTGLQEASCRIHALGEGISHAIGTGGRDVTDALDGASMKQALDLLAGDDATRVICIISKPPSPRVARRICEHARSTGKGCVILFLGAGADALPGSPRLVFAATLSEAARAAVALARGGAPAAPRGDEPPEPSLVAEEARRLARGQWRMAGLFSGGTFCAEAQAIWTRLGLRVSSNVPLDGVQAVSASDAGEGHVAIDFGTEGFTTGRPHPMIDMSARVEALAALADDPGGAAVVLDVVLGYGSHTDPAGALAPAIGAAKARAAQAGRHLCVVAFVCGTEHDPQHLSSQQAELAAAGALLAESSTAASRLAAAIAAAAGRAHEAHGVQPVAS